MIVNDADCAKKLESLEHAAMLGIPSVLALALTILSRRFLFIIELCGPVFITGVVITSLVLNEKMHEGGVDTDRFSGQLFMLYGSCFICVFFLTPSYLKQVITRQVITLPLLWIEFWLSPHLRENKFS